MAATATGQVNIVIVFFQIHNSLQPPLEVKRTVELQIAGLMAVGRLTQGSLPVLFWRP